jgi:GDP-L-fucose synthase
MRHWWDGFLGRNVIRQLQERGAKDIFVPLIQDYNLVEPGDVARVLDDAKPDVIIHLAAHVGGIAQTANTRLNSSTIT